ncbi:MAG TPA: iron uptake transporter permease EfeU [Candidatus Limnocylindrales bacterium]|nr:iron uptake transporter permease EfeU [Candidatus Limnocylindrales bacterium]
MNLGALSSGLLTGLREGVEAALIVSIVLAYLAKTGNRQYFDRIWLGAGAAIALSLVLGVALFVTIGGFEEPYEQIFEGIVMLVAAGVVTWMLFWMRRQAASVKGELHARIDRALSEGTVWGLTLLAFTAVIREGIETSLFLVGQVNSADTAAPSVLLGAVIGLAIAALLGYGFYRGSRRLNLASFFKWTGVGLVFIAAGLLSHAVHEFIEVGIIQFGTQTAFDISAILPHDEADGNLIGQFLRALFGYSATPEVTTLVVHVGYLVTVLLLYLRPTAPRRPLAPQASTGPAGA